MWAYGGRAVSNMHLHEKLLEAATAVSVSCCCCSASISAGQLLLLVIVLLFFYCCCWCFSDTLDQPLPVAAAANEAFKQAKAKGYGDADFAAVYEAIQVSGSTANTPSP
jgi:hypothetical protein